MPLPLGPRRSLLTGYFFFAVGLVAIAVGRCCLARPPRVPHSGSATPSRGPPWP